MTTKWARLCALTPPQRGVLVRALAQLPLTVPALKLLGLRRVQAVAAGRVTPRGWSEEGALEAAAEMASIVDMAARHCVVPTTCLHRSVVLWGMLQRRGIDCDLRIGVLRPPDAAVPAFHAWVERDGVALNDRQDVASRYAVFNHPITPPGVRFS